MKLQGSSKRKIYAIYSDVRLNGRTNKVKIDALIEDGTENQFMYRNLYVIGAIKKMGTIFHSSNDLFKALENE